MHENTSIEELGKVEFVQAIRDFFLAKNAKEMQNSLESLLYYSDEKKEKTDFRLLKLEYAFNRLFLGEHKLLAPPFASTYLGKEAHNIDSFLNELGLDFTSDTKLPSDHISIELEIWLVLSNVLENLNGKMLGLASNSDDFMQARALLLDMTEKMHWLETEHLALWIRKFIQKMYAIPEEIEKLNEQIDKEDLLLDEIVYIAACLEAWLDKYTDEK